MKIAYRRMSGTVSFSAEEKGSRGLWWEKRQGLVRWLVARGHSIDLVSRLSKKSDSGLLGLAPYDPARHEVLMVEFGSSNERFNGADLTETMRIANAHKGLGIFLCDDPDLPFLWDRLHDVSKWVAWTNARYPEPIGKQPAIVPSLDFPFAAVLTPPPLQPNRAAASDELVYLGRPNGRAKSLRMVLSSGVPLRVYSKPADWDGFDVVVGEPPSQPKRRAWYASKGASLVLADAKHKRMGFRTGRAYHALLAGTPFLYERDHKAFAGCVGGFADAPQLLAQYNLAYVGRGFMVQRQREWADPDRAICIDTANRAGL